MVCGLFSAIAFPSADRPGRKGGLCVDWALHVPYAARGVAAVEQPDLVRAELTPMLR